MLPLASRRLSNRTGVVQRGVGIVAARRAEHHETTTVTGIVFATVVVALDAETKKVGPRAVRSGRLEPERDRETPLRTTTERSRVAAKPERRAGRGTERAVRTERTVCDEPRRTGAVDLEREFCRARSLVYASIHERIVLDRVKVVIIEQRPCLRGLRRRERSGDCK